MLQTPARLELETLLIELPKTLRLHITQEQFTLLTAANRDLKLERTVQGELIVNPPTGWETGERNRSLTGQLDRWYEENEDLGRAFDSSTGFILPNGATRSPDASWVSRERWEVLTPEQRGTFAQICPDFVVELRSSSDRLSSLQAKMREYIENGARLGWLIDPQHRRVEIYRPGLAVEVLENPAELSGEEVLSCYAFNLYNTSEQDARTTIFSRFRIIQFSCTSAYLVLC